MAADIAIAIGIDPSEAKAGRDQIIRWNDDIAASYDKVLAASKAAGSQSAGSGVQHIRDQKAAVDDLARTYDRASAAIMQGELQRAQAAQKAAAEQERTISRLTGAYTPHIAELQRLAKDEATINSLRAAGAMDAKVAEQALAGLHARQAIVSAESARMAAGAKLSANEWRNMSYQINDVVSGLAMGQSPFMILTQQGGQFVQIFQAAGIAISGAAVGIGGLVASLGLATAAAISHYNSMRQVASAYALQGGYVGQSRSQLEALAQQTAATGDISVREARNIEAATMRAGQVSRFALRQIASSARDVADALTDGDLEAAGKLLTQAFLDPEKAAKQLDGTLNILTDTQRRQISVLAGRNDKDAAFNVLLGALNPRLKDHAAQINPITQAWREATNALSDYYDRFGRLLTPKTTQEQLDEATAGQSVFGGLFANPIDAARIKRLQDKLAVEQAMASFDADMAKFRDQSKTGGLIAEATDPSYSRLKELRENRDKLQASINSGITIGESAEAIQQRRAALEAYNHALATYITDGQKAALMAEAQAKAATMDASQGAAYLARRQAEISLMGQAVTQSEREQAIRAASVQARAAWNASTSTAIRNLEVETQAQQNLNAAIGRGYEARAKAEQENAVAAAKRQNPGMTAAEEAELRRQLSRGAESKRVNAEFTDLDALKQSAANENALADARLRGAEALRKANVEIETQKRLKQYGGNEADIRAALEAESLAKQRAEFAQQAISSSATLSAQQQANDLDLVIAKMRELGATEQEIAQVYQNAEIAKLEATQNWADGAKASVMRYSQTASNMGAIAGNAVSSGMRSMENALISFSSKTMTAAQAFKSMAASIIQDLIRMQVQASITGPLSKSIGGMFSGPFGGGMGGYSAGDTMSQANYGAWASYNTQAVGVSPVGSFASGTESTPPGLIRVGENGPELLQQPGGARIYPADETAAILNPKAANSNQRGGGNVVQITNYVEAGASMADVEAAVAAGINQAAPHLINAAVQQSVPASVGAVQNLANRGGSFSQAVGRR